MMSEVLFYFLKAYELKDILIFSECGLLKVSDIMPFSLKMSYSY